MSLAGGRAPQKTEGDRLSELLEAEEDEFYQMIYGSSPRKLEMMSIKETSQTQSTRWTLTLTLKKGMNHPVMVKQKNQEGSTE
ncbi:Vacuolar protein sorting-associated protein 72-like protein [Sciurus carolinensis]|uniref:Vacuolar protein sorting-associated protein 72-like protein n=1 Tax=Sciurus carolinensis TaxID=30640 RepID=A0AA41N5H3_SCICA|nr:Vacuolar protein sorting-associated protein 72-like protein [Sciurus carolinensis]